MTSRDAKTGGGAKDSTASGPGGGFTVPLGQAASGRLVFTAGAEGVTLLGEPGLHGLAQASFLRGVLWAGFEEGILKVEYRRSAPPEAGGPRLPGDVIRLNASIPWEIEFRGGASRITARLGCVQLRSLDVLGGASQISLELSRPEGTAFVYLAGGASQVAIRRPPGAGVELAIQGGADRLSLDGRQLRSLPGDGRVESAEFNRQAGRYEISIAGGASDVEIAFSKQGE